MNPAKVIFIPNPILSSSSYPVKRTKRCKYRNSLSLSPNNRFERTADAAAQAETLSQ